MTSDVQRQLKIQALNRCYVRLVDESRDTEDGKKLSIGFAAHVSHSGYSIEVYAPRRCERKDSARKR
jgi:hypothetical protein